MTFNNSSNNNNNLLLALCSLDCGPNGRCLGAGCVCTPGWQGQLCQEQTCDDRCSGHGQCKNGSCVCQLGFFGRHCTLAGCGDDGKCHGHGTCEANTNSHKESSADVTYS